MTPGALSGMLAGTLFVSHRPRLNRESPSSSITYTRVRDPEIAHKNKIRRFSGCLARKLGRYRGGFESMEDANGSVLADGCILDEVFSHALLQRSSRKRCNSRGTRRILTACRSTGQHVVPCDGNLVGSPTLPTYAIENQTDKYWEVRRDDPLHGVWEPTAIYIRPVDLQKWKATVADDR